MCAESLCLTMLSVWCRGSVHHSTILTVKPPNKMQKCINMFIIPYFKWSSTCFGRHTAHYQEPKTAQAASGFAYVKGCWTCSCWTLSGSVRYRTTSNLVHLFLVYLYLSISTCFRRLWVHHHEKQLCLCDTWYLLFCVDNWYAGWNSTLHTKLCTKLVLFTSLGKSLF